MPTLPPTPQQALEHLFRVGFYQETERLPESYGLQRPGDLWKESLEWSWCYGQLLSYLVLYGVFSVRADGMFASNSQVQAPQGKNFQHLFRQMMEQDPRVRAVLVIDPAPPDALELTCLRAPGIDEDAWIMAVLRHEERAKTDATHDRRHAMAAALRELGCRDL
jgi:hypothetical protein